MCARRSARRGSPGRPGGSPSTSRPPRCPRPDRASTWPSPSRRWSARGSARRPSDAARTVHLGELGLDGRVRPVRGVLPAVVAAVASGHPRVVVAAADAVEASLVPGAQVVRRGLARRGAACLRCRRRRARGRRGGPGRARGWVRAAPSATCPTSSGSRSPGMRSRSPRRAGTTCSWSDRRAPGRPCSLRGCPVCCPISTTQTRSRSPRSTPSPAPSARPRVCCDARRSRTRTTRRPRLR